jgi:hypothetical protein
MDQKAFALLTALSGLELTESDSRELYDYTRQLFASLKPQPGQPGAADAGTADQVKRIFGKARSIQELDLTQVEPAVNFGIEDLSGD